MFKKLYLNKAVPVTWLEKCIHVAIQILLK